MSREKKCLDVIISIERVFNTYSSYSQSQREYYQKGGNYYEKEVHILKEIIENPTQTITQIAEKTNRTKSSVSQVVKRLVEKNLISLEKSNTDKRKVIFNTTEQGRKLYEAHNRYDDKMAYFLSEFFSEFSDEEIEKFEKMLNKYNQYILQGYSLKDL